VGLTRRFLCRFFIYRAARLICDHERHFEKVGREKAEKLEKYQIVEKTNDFVRAIALTKNPFASELQRDLKSSVNRVKLACQSSHMSRQHAQDAANIFLGKIHPYAGACQTVRPLGRSSINNTSLNHHPCDIRPTRSAKL
jgi:hypothetical protein